MSRFDHPYTCNSIDEALNDLKGFLQDELDSFADSVVDAYEDPDESYTRDLDFYLTRIYEYCEEACERVRTENQDMRDAAEKQLDSMADEIEDITDEKNHIEFDRDNLQTTVDDLEDEVLELKEQIIELENELSC